MESNSRRAVGIAPTDPSVIVHSGVTTSDAAQTAVSDGRRNNLDFLRLSFAVLVIFSHSFILGGNKADEPFAWLTKGQSDGGMIAVDCFFILSGYLITASFLRSSSVRDYMVKRIRRIYPGFITTFALGVWIVPLIIGVPASEHFDAGGILHFFFRALKLRELNQVGAFPRNPFPDWVNGSLWTIGYEFGCYVLVAVLGLLGVLSRRALTAGLFLVTVAFAVNARVLHFEVLDRIHLGVFHWIRFVPLYLSGVVAWLYRDRIRFTQPGVLASLLAIGVAAMVPNAWETVFAFAGTYILLWFAQAPSIRLHDTGKYGDFSYGIYLYAYPVQQILVWSRGGRMSPFPLFLTATLITLPFAFASWYFVEMPFIRGKQR